ncbi:MAG: addiction module killer protein [uncultured bacterium]|nr:MAG: addiction module killer protein [uncultured bacterium]OGT26097.1 MAG: addiction module killer protein [Gammaproteobacteria bacterium RIFCSPHIGHO2_02_FULL_42_43]OGT28478.1 MAG: addiction module killer protein [Gammaproteobacteria bacterium RIFCSPHIGHO2_01_FULL_42_8]OGT50880.1 MAG: addiction module killer protein [Gammaproteobacteria bacterium RIFCSPHIGHO2_12_FULL_41_25]OGT62839.1 MAG: addiction module killer protein [Gammaproteobacteria bacterium RIFCSPLOWO2_02_FULL_42_14]OGT86797.1 MAG
MEKELIFYETPTGKVPFQKWLSGIRDKRAQVKIEVRLNRLINGNYGDCKLLRNGVSELRIDYGPGYRVYFGEHQNSLVIVLLLGGTKKKQKKDIDLAIQYWEDYKRIY